MPDYKQDIIRKVQIGVQVNTDDIKKSSATLDNFYKKYQSKDMRVDTSDFFQAVDAVRALKKELDTVQKNSPHMEGIIAQMSGGLKEAEQQFKDAIIRFTNGDVAHGLNEAVNKVSQGFQIKNVDLGGFLSGAQNAIKETTDALDRLGAIKQNYDKSKFIELDNLNTSQLETAIALMQKLKDTQLELDSFNGAPLKRGDFYSNTSTQSLSNYIQRAQEDLDELKQLNLRTINELREREELMSSLNHKLWSGYGKDDLFYMKSLSTSGDTEQLKEQLTELQNYVNTSEDLLRRLQDNSHLFQPGEITDDINILRDNVNQAKSYLQEFQQLDTKTTLPQIGGDFSELVRVLNEIRTSLQTISETFQNTEASMRGMAESSKTSFEGLSQTILEVYNNLTQIQTLVDTISKKDFNINNITQVGGGDSNLQAMIQQMAKAREQMEHLFALYDQAGSTLQSLAQKGQTSLVFDYQKQLADFDPTAIAKSVKSANSEMKLASVIAEMQDYIDKFIQINELRNKFDLGGWKDTFVPTKQFDIAPTTQAKPQTTGTPTSTQPQSTVATTNAEAQQMYQLKAAIDEVSNAIGRKNAGFVKEKEIVDASVNAEEAKLRELVGVITNEIGNALDGIKEKFAQSFVTPEINKVGLQESLNGIYNEFTKLQKNIEDLKINVGVGTIVEATQEASVVDSASNTEEAVGGESQSAKDANESFTDATNAKKEFTEANKQVAKSAEETTKAVEKEAEAAKKAKETMMAVADDTEVLTDWDKEIKLQEGHNEDPFAVSRSKTDNVGNESVRTVIETWGLARDEDGELTGEMELNTVKIINDYKKRTDAITKENEKIETAQAYLKKFLTQFDNKTMGQGRMLNGYQELANLASSDDFKIDDIARAEQMMSNLDAEYNKVVQSMRKGSSSMNPFVNAINNMGKMEDILRNIQLQYQGLDKQPQWLGDDIVDLYRQFDNLSGETDIYRFAEGFGNLKIAINAVTEAIRQQRAEQKIAFNEDNLTQSIFVKGADIDLMLAKWREQGILTDDVRHRVDALAEALWNITSKNDLSLWTKQWQEVVKTMQLANIEAKNAEKANKEYANIFEAAEKEKAATLVDWEKIKGSYQIKAAKEDDGSQMQAFYLEQVEKVQARINALKKQAALTDEEKNALNKIELDTQERIAEIQQKRMAVETNKANFVPQDEKIQNKYEAGYLSDDLYNDWQKELAEYRNYLAGVTEADEATIQSKKRSLMQMYDSLTKMSNASKSFFTSGGEILPTWLTPEQMQNTKQSLMGLYNSISAERFEGMKTSVTSVSEKLGTLTFAVDDGKGSLTQYTIALDRASGATKLLSNSTKPALTIFQRFGQHLKKDFTGVLHTIIGGSGIHAFTQYIREGVQAVRELDLALTELKKVTDETEATYDKFLGTAAATSSRIGRTITDVVSATAEFAKLGYGIDQAAPMAESALVYTNVGDNVDIDTGSQSIISTMKAFGVEANNTMSIVDKFNEVGKLIACR